MISVCTSDRQARIKKITESCRVRSDSYKYHHILLRSKRLDSVVRGPRRKVSREVNRCFVGVEKKKTKHNLFVDCGRSRKSRPFSRPFRRSVQTDEKPLDLFDNVLNVPLSSPYKRPVSTKVCKVPRCIIITRYNIM